MAVVANIGGQQSGGLAGLATPVLLALAGGGVGLIFLLRRRQSQGSGTSGDQQTLLPNTAIMLGSLQESLLNLQGSVSQGNADLGAQVSGVGENLGAQLDALTSQQQNALTTLQTNLTNVYDQNTATITDALKAQGTTLSTLIGTSQAAQAAADKSLASGLIQGLDLLTAQHNAELTGIQALGGQINSATGAVTGLSDALNARLSSINQQISGIGVGVDTANKTLAGDPTNSWLSPLNGKWFLQDLGGGKGGGMIYVTGGKAYNVGWDFYTRATGKQEIDNATSFWASPTQYAPLQQVSQGVLK